MHAFICKAVHVYAIQNHLKQFIQRFQGSFFGIVVFWDEKLLLEGLRLPQVEEFLVPVEIQHGAVPNHFN